MTRHDTPGRRNAARLIIRLLLTGAIVLTISALLPLEQGPALPGLRATSVSLSAVVAILLLQPTSDQAFTDTMLVCVASAIVVLLLLLGDSQVRLIGQNLPRLMVTLVLLSATFLFAARHLSMAVTVALFVLSTAMPIWAAPFVEITGNPDWLNRLVVHLSPLTAIAVAVDFDFLRAEWFYANSALGSMRYTYPGWIPTNLTLAVIPAAAFVHERLRSAPSPIAVSHKEVHP